MDQQQYEIDTTTLVLGSIYVALLLGLVIWIL